MKKESNIDKDSLKNSELMNEKMFYDIFKDLSKDEGLFTSENYLDYIKTDLFMGTLIDLSKEDLENIPDDFTDEEEEDLK